MPSSPATDAPETAASPPAGNNTPPVDPEALSFDERIQRIVNGEGLDDGSGGGAAATSMLGGSSGEAGMQFPSDPPLPAEETAIPVAEASAPEEPTAVAEDSSAAPRTAENYNPADTFPAPGPGDNPLGRTHDLLDAFLRAPDWESRIRYTYQGESLRPVIEEYYKKWPVTSMDRYARQLFQMEPDVELGGPYWVYLISTSDLDQGFPVIIRVEDGLLKVDWEIYSEFQDRHFVEFQKGAIASPHTFRLVIERVSDYYGSDRETFENLDDYYVYQINPPYGDLNEFSEYAFVKKDSEVASQLDAVVGLGEEPLAVIITLEQEMFAHGTKHIVIEEYLTEGWFR